MTHPSKFYSEFWKSMGERFGKRWFDQTGPVATTTWRELLDQFTRDEVDTALLRLKDRPEKYRRDPPTYTEFQALLAAAAKTRKVEGPAASKQHWRSITVKTCMQHAGLLNIVPWGTINLRDLPTNIFQIIGPICERLIDDAARLEQQNGRTKEMEQHINTTLWNALKPYKREDVPRGSNSNQAGAAPSDAVAVSS